MADEKVSAEEMLSEEQRIALLEKKAGTNRIVLFIIALLLIIVTSVSITAISMLIFEGGDAASNEELVALKEQLAGLQEKVANYDERLLTLGSQTSELKGKIASTSNATLQSTLVEQEAHIQRFLSSLRSATFDLAHMVPGSRAWLDLYSTEIDDAIVESENRERRLRALNAGTPVTEEDPFFGGDF